MYSHDLKIVIFSDNKLLEDEIRLIKPQEAFSHNITVLPYFSEQALKDAELVIMDEHISMSFHEVRAAMPPGSFLIAVMSVEEEASLTEEEFECLDDVWLIPLQKPRIRLRMNNILHGIKGEADARQHLIWLDTLMDSMPDLVWFKDMQGIHYKVNSKFCEFVKKDRANVIGCSHSRIWGTAEDDESCRESEEAAIMTGRTVLTDEIVKTGNEQHLFKTYKTPLRSPGGEILGTVGFGHDMTNLLNLDMELKFFIESMPFPLVICNARNEIQQVNSRFMEFFVGGGKGLVGTPYENWHESTFQMEVSPVNGDSYLRFAGPEKMHYVSRTCKNILDIFGKQVGSVNIYRDITAEKELENRIWREANTDSLTGLANRNAFDSYVKNLSSRQQIHLYYIDLDEFKAVNDRWGHKAGDEALKIVAKAIRNVFAQDYPVRLGGDEFLVCVQREVPLSELERLAERFLQRIQEKLGASEQLERISGSIGIRSGGTVADTMELLIRQADAAMYMAKTMGKGRYCIWHEEMGPNAA